LRAPWPKSPLFEFSSPSCDLFHGLNQRLPKRTQSPAITTFHDLFVLTGDYSTPDFRRRFEAQAREAAARSTRIIAVSRFTAAQVASLLNFPADRIDVVHHGVDGPSQTKPISSRKPIVLTVGAVQARKNTGRLLEAFRALPAPWELWIAGSAGYRAGEMLATAGDRVRVLGYVSDEEVARLYGEASIFAFPSLDEGFGMPVLEAMAHGLPVLTSDRSALPEVAAGAALLVDPTSTEAIAAGLIELTDDARREHFAALGLERVRGCSWEKAARETFAVYERCLEARP
jgi:glycosyltransferase involved in cell wall biosynthesis